MKLLFFLSVLALKAASCLHLYLIDGAEKCLTDEIPAQTVIITELTWQLCVSFHFQLGFSA